MSVDAGGTQGNSFGVLAIMSISADGHYAAGAGLAGDLVPERTYRAWYGNAESSGDSQTFDFTNGGLPVWSF